MAADHREVVEQDCDEEGRQRPDGGDRGAPFTRSTSGSAAYRGPTRDEPDAARTLSGARDRRDGPLGLGVLVPSFERDYGFVSLRHPTDYPITEGRSSRATASTSRSPSTTNTSWRSTSRTSGAPLVAAVDREPLPRRPARPLQPERGPSAPARRRAAEDAGIGDGCRNPFRSIVVRAVELVHACDEAIDIIDSYEPPDPPAVAGPPRAGPAPARRRHPAVCCTTGTSSTRTA